MPPLPTSIRVAAAATLMLTLAACESPRREVAVGPTAIDRLARSLTIIRTATPTQPKVLRVLFYGQSITSPKWTDLAVAHLKRTYPNVRFVTRNMGIGGFAADHLVRIAERDLDEFYPDLIVFHDYGNDKLYERIIRLMRERTAAEITVETDHVTNPVEPVCPTGLRHTISLPPGCVGTWWLHQHWWEDYMSNDLIPRLATRYGLAVEPRRRWWNAYLMATNTAPDSLLVDHVHPNDQGWRLAAGIFDRWFDRVVAAWRGERSDLVRSIPWRGGTRTTLTFDGNRMELIARAPLNGQVIARIDGEAPPAIDGCWQTSRATLIPGTPGWPAAHRITIDPAFHRAEQWTATLTDFDPAKRTFRFAVEGAATGPDGEGSADKDFVSPSGRVRIAAQDWTVPLAMAAQGVGLPEGFQIGWSRGFACGDQPPVMLKPGVAEVRYVIATGIRNGSHKVELQLTPAAAALVQEIRVYHPPLRARDD